MGRRIVPPLLQPLPRPFHSLARPFLSPKLAWLNRSFESQYKVFTIRLTLSHSCQAAVSLRLVAAAERKVLLQTVQSKLLELEYSRLVLLGPCQRADSELYKKVNAHLKRVVSAVKALGARKTSSGRGKGKNKISATDPEKRVESDQESDCPEHFPEDISGW
ncbi:hypothetical protein R3P38DRAFT_2806664 [Favolaschia claudopus]|uniref:Uncharacterized protein n=1 Tax=Favolaschia claudopus TaxID=2862362 RepID=A0AAV9ZJ48_9AGAR